MKTLSLKLDDTTFDEAVSLYNQFNKRKILKNKLLKESKLTMKDSLKVLHEFEKFVDEN